MSNLKYAYYMMGMFSYGFLRNMRAEYAEPENVLGTRVGHSLLNGVVYMSPCGVLYLRDFVNRADVYWTDKNPEKYEKIYRESSGYKNKNVFL